MTPDKPSASEAREIEKIAGMDLLALAAGLEDNLCHRYCACPRDDGRKDCIQERAASVLRAVALSQEDRKIMGSPEDAKASLIEKARAWREARQPSMATAKEHRQQENIEREIRFQLANAALLWLWHEENPASSPAPQGGEREMKRALEKIIEMNLQYAFDRYGDETKAEDMACVKVARAALCAQVKEPEDGLSPAVTVSEADPNETTVMSLQEAEIARLRSELGKLRSRLSKLPDTLGVTDIGRLFIKEHPEIFTDKRPPMQEDGK